MKILFLVKYYDGFIESLNQKVNLNLSYQELHDIVLKESSNIFAPFISEFQKIGHESSMIIPNFDLLQKKWCKENKVEFNENWLMSAPKKQIEKEKPDILFTSSNFEYYGDFLSDLKPFIGKICAWISCPFDDGLELSNINHIFTLFKPHYDAFIKKGISTTLTHAAFDKSVISKLPVNKIHDFTFIGGIGGHHKQREQQLKKLIKSTSLKIWGYGYVSNNPIKNILKQIKSGFVYAKVFQGEAWGVDMLKILAQSKITFNSHGDIAKGHAVNMRMFEATGVGTLLLTEYTEDITNFFEPNKEIVCYTSAEDAIRKVNYYLEHDDERERIALAGQKRTLENYSYEHLAKEYVQVFEKLLNE